MVGNNGTATLAANHRMLHSLPITNNPNSPITQNRQKHRQITQNQPQFHSTNHNDNQNCFATNHKSETKNRSEIARVYNPTRQVGFSIGVEGDEDGRNRSPIDSPIFNHHRKPFDLRLSIGNQPRTLQHITDPDREI
ncbi:hypothetical protein Droror1_Dr00022287 [Drosera rotundifolia]